MRALTWLLKALFALLTWPFRLIGRLLAWVVRPIKERIRQGKIYQFFTYVPEDKPVLDAFDTAIHNPESFMDELESVRKHLLRALIALILAVLVSLAFSRDLMHLLAQPIGGMDKLQAIEVTEGIGVFMRIALLGGIAIASPYIAFETWLFFAPGLMPQARLTGLLAIPSALIFFLGGAAFAYYVMLPAALPFLLSFAEFETVLRPASYFPFVTGLMFWLGVAFQFPLVIFAISAMGLIQPRQLFDQWRLAVVLIAVVAAAITPTVDPVNMGLVMLPMIALYFLSIFFSWLANWGRR